MHPLWIALSGDALVLGGSAWFSKLAMVVATDGRVAYTGAAGASCTLGFALMLPGSTGVGLRLTLHREGVEYDAQPTLVRRGG